MTMNKIAAKLRCKNNGQYRLLGICIFLSVLLVSSFTMMFFSPSIQEFLPPGGDTRKLMWLMLGVVSIGCLLFTLYGSSLFFRKKSREFGVMLALGAPKKELARQLAGELAAVTGKYILGGILSAIPVSFLIWKLFQTIVINTAQMQYRFGIAGILAGILFAVMLSVCILILGIRFIRRANIMDILNAGRKTEMVREIKPWYGKLGTILIITGLFLAMAVPQLTVRIFRQGMPGIWNSTYLFSAAGLYLLLLSGVAHSKKGKHPEKYYRNIISTNLMRFAARQTTRNMCVIALLVFVMVLAAFWGVMYYYSATEGGTLAPYDYSLHFPAGESQIGQGDIEELAGEYGTELLSYEELYSLELIIRYTGRDMDDQKRYFDVEYEKLSSFVSASDFERISGKSVLLKEGGYLTVTASGYQESIWVNPDCLSEIRHPVTGDTLKPQFQGTVEFDNLALTGEPFVFILADADYQRLQNGLTDAYKEKHILFNARHTADTVPPGCSCHTKKSCPAADTSKAAKLCPAMYDFADAWKNAYIARATALSNHYSLYDAREEELAAAAGEEYGYTGKIDLTPENTQLTNDWKYAPFSKVLMQADAMEMVAVFVLLSLYIAVISLTAAGIMSYIRSITVAMDNRQLFENLRRLGANDAYAKRVIKLQLRKIFAYPVTAGCTVVGVFSLFLTYFNDMGIQAFEVKMLLMELVLMALIAGVMYCVHRLAYGKSKKIAGCLPFTQ